MADVEREALTREQADTVEAEMRALESDPATTATAMRLFMQHPMPCGHATGNLLTCPTPPYGCVVCNDAPTDGASDTLPRDIEAALDNLARVGVPATSAGLTSVRSRRAKARNLILAQLATLRARAERAEGAAMDPTGLMAAVRGELDHAYRKHGRDPWGRHEFYAILLEEVEELWAEIKADAPQEKVLAELRQVAAMCFRYAETGDRYRGEHPTIPTRDPLPERFSS